jgi:hypothetical protein
MNSIDVKCVRLPTSSPPVPRVTAGGEAGRRATRSIAQRATCPLIELSVSLPGRENQHPGSGHVGSSRSDRIWKPDERKAPQIFRAWPEDPYAGQRSDIHPTLQGASGEDPPNGGYWIPRKGDLGKEVNFGRAVLSAALMNTG